MSSPTKTRRPRGLGFRLTAWYATVLCAAVLGAGAILYFQLVCRCCREPDKYLRVLSADFADFVADHLRDLDAVRSKLRSEPHDAGETHVVHRLSTPDGRVLVRSAAFPDAACDLGAVAATLSRIDPAPPRTVPAPGSPVRITARTVRAGGKVVYLAETGVYIDQACETVTSHRANILGLLVPLSMVGVVGGWWLTRKSLAPIAHMSEAAKTISREVLDKRLPVTGSGDELDHLAEVLNEMLDRLHDSFERIERFSFDLAHELRTPLTALRTEAERALTGRRSADELRAIIAAQTEAYERLNSMISDLLLLSRNGAPPAREPFEPVDLAACVGDVLDTFSPLAEEAGVTLTQSGPDAPCRVDGDPRMLLRLFCNLLDNAIKHTPPGGTVSVSLVPGEMCTVIVRDTGCGIAPRDLPHVFDRFFRGDPSRSRDTGGAGLGLSISKQIAEDHGGTITIQSHLGQGTEVTVRLPRGGESAR